VKPDDGIARPDPGSVVDDEAEAPQEAFAVFARFINAPGYKRRAQHGGEKR
jgi:hypothetical protein